MPALLLILAVWGSVASGVEFDPESESIMELRLARGRLMSDGMVVYPDRLRWYLPLGALADSLGLAIGPTPDLKKAEGFFLKPEVPFELNMESRGVVVGDRTFQFGPGDILPYQGDLYVAHTKLEEWFDFDFTIDVQKLRIVLATDHRFPQEEREDRKTLVSGQGEAYDPGYPRLDRPDRLWDGPFVDAQVTTRTTVLGNQSDQYRFSTIWGSELLGFETLGIFSGTLAGIGAARVTASRFSRDGTLLGPMQAKSLSLINVDLPPDTLLSNGRPIVGALASSRPRYQPSRFDSTDVEGAMPEGWEALLYRNSILINRLEAPIEGRYIFRGVPLVYGRNVLKVVLIGPRGEREDRYQTLEIDPNVLKEGSTLYDAGIGLDTDRQLSALIRYQSHVADLGSLNVSLAHLGPFGAFGKAGVVTLFKPVVAGLECSLAGKGGYACGVRSRTGLGVASLGANYSHFGGGFISPLLQDFPGLVGEGVLQLEHPIMWVNALFNWSLTHRTFSTTDGVTELAARVSLPFWRQLLTASIQYQLSPSPSWSGDVDLLSGSRNLRWLVGATLTNSEFDELEGELAFGDPDGGWNSTIGSTYNFKTRQTGLDMGLIYQFEDLSLGGVSEYRTSGDWQVGLQLRTTVLWDARRGEAYFTRLSGARSGAAEISVFEDPNRNGKQDAGEKGVPGIGVRTNRRLVEGVTNKEGLLFVPRLRPDWPLDLQVTEESFEDPFFGPGLVGLRLYPKLGRIDRIRVPVVFRGFVDGQVLRRRGGMVPVPNAEVQLMQGNQLLATAFSDGEGYYEFTGLAPGQYWVKLAPPYLGDRKLRVEPLRHEATVPQEGGYVSLKPFKILRK